MRILPQRALGLFAPALLLFSLLLAPGKSFGQWRRISLTANPSSVSFGSVQVGGNKAQNVTITNPSSYSRTISTANLAGSGFKISGLALPNTLGPAGSVTFTVTFSPVSVGASAGNLTLTWGSYYVRTLAVPLSGTGLGTASLSAQPASLNFGSVAVGASKTLSATLTAKGAAAVISSVTTSSREFSVTGLSLPVTIAAGQSVPFSVRFAPQSSGAASGSLSFGGNGSGGPAVQTVAGTGTAATQHKVNLSWGARPAVAGYNIYRGGTAGGPYAKLHSGPDPISSFSDDSVQGGRTYYYVVTSVDATGVESGYSNEARAVVPNN